MLVNRVQEAPLHAMQFQGYEAKRKVMTYGFDWSFEKRSLSKGIPLPPHFHFLIERVAACVGIPMVKFAELLLTEYPVGSVIKWHRDAPPFEMVAGISLGSPCNFRFRPQDPAKQNRKSIISLNIEPCSLYIMQGPSRWEWQHSTTPVKEVRYSITLRTLKENVIAPVD